MPGPKAQTPAPIDRPLSRAYLREFSGWSTAYPPGLSEPTSLRIMENVQINRDGSSRVRPGLRYLSYASAGVAAAETLVGTHEAFYLNDGSKAYLFAVREADQTVGFRVLVPGSSGNLVHRLTDIGIDFALAQAESTLNFSARTTYVKYLQIDNKIFALSNAGESMRLFHVGASKQAKTLTAITRPEWTVGDKLTVVHPDAAWVNTGIPGDGRKNLLPNPSFETGVQGWTAGSRTKLTRVADPNSVSGAYVLRVETTPSSTNMMPRPLHKVIDKGFDGWISSNVGDPALSVDSTYMKISASKTGPFYARSPEMVDVVPGTAYGAVADVSASGSVSPRIRYRFFAGNGNQIGEDIERTGYFWSDPEPTQMRYNPATAPAGAVTMRVLLGGEASSSGAWVSVKRVRVFPDSESGSFFTGSSGTNYFWTGAVDDSPSVYHPAAVAYVTTPRVSISPSTSVCGSASGRTDQTPQIGFLLRAYDAAGTQTDMDNPAISDVGIAPNTWHRKSVRIVAPAATAVSADMQVTIISLARGKYYYLDAAMIEPGVTVPGTYFDGATPDTPTLVNSWTGATHNSPSVQTSYSVGATVPSAETKTTKTLISVTPEANVYQFGFFYVFSNEVGDSAASPITVVRAQRGWSQWRWEIPNTAGEPSGIDTSVPEKVADQFVASMPEGVFLEAQAQGATSWSLYTFAWSDQDPVPVTAVKVATRPVTAESTYDTHGWIRVTPAVSGTGSEISVLPSEANRYNFSDPSKAGQGLVAADRMILVHDPSAAAVIRWSSNQQGNYSDFSASRGGGYKTLTSGNLFIPACVKLWQNPQSADTLTILCQGTDGHSTGYYMAPAQVASQSEATNIMGFEETTATPGTTSPYGCEVFNNSLYHPLDDQLMKSTASNYNINHKSQTDQIRNVWEKLTSKERIVSAVHDNRLYYIVTNPDGAPIETGCNGNEIWVLDGGSEKGTWSRWLIQAHSMRKIEFGGRIFMSVVRPDGLFYLDPEYGLDDVVSADRAVTPRPIAWKLETNTQGANRAHDAWAHVQQVNVILGNFSGAIRYGIRSWDIHGQPVEITKVVRDANPAGLLNYDLDDNLLVRRDLKEWFFFAESVEGEPSFGQLNLVQYRYTPSTVNTGYEYGSVETFEYGRAAAGSDSTTTNGIPLPVIDTRRP